MIFMQCGYGEIMIKFNFIFEATINVNSKLFPPFFYGMKKHLMNNISA